MPLNKMLIKLVTNLAQNNDEFLSAKQDEQEKWKNFNVYTEVPDQGQERINGCWVCTRKTVDGKEIPKARHVIKVFKNIQKFKLIPQLVVKTP